MIYKDLKPRFVTTAERKLLGKKMKISLSGNKTTEIWRGFMPQRKLIKNNVNNELISMQVFNGAMNPGDLNQQFEKWACVEVEDFEGVPDEMHTFILAPGLYAVFNYKGLSSDSSIFKYIFGTWLPGSGYELDNRPHFEILGEKYKNNDPESEEEIWLPVKEK